MPLAYMSHFVCDFIPHSGTGDMSVRDKRFLRILYIDMVLAVACTLLVASFWNELGWLIIACAFLAASPDLAWLYYRYFYPKKKLDLVARFHKKIQWSETHKGYYFEAIWFLVFFGGLVYFGTK